MEPEEEYEILIDGNVEVVVVANQREARREIAHYMQQYKDDGDMLVRKVTRTYEYVYPEQL